MDETERNFRLYTIASEPDGTVAMSGEVGIAQQRLKLDRESWRKIGDLVDWARRKGIEKPAAADVVVRR